MISSVSTFVLSFFIYSFLGYLCEVVYCSVPQRRFVNRGFLYGPYLPIYGTGAVVVVYILRPFTSRWYLVFILGLISTSAIEYITSWGLEKLFKVKLWDYSTYPLNLNGRVCALNSTLFGLLSLFIMYVVNAPLQRLLFRLSPSAAEILSLLVVALIASDTSFSVVKMASFRMAIAELEDARKELHVKLQTARESFSADNLKLVVDRLNAEYESKKNKYYKNMKRIMNSNPSLSVKSERKAQLVNARAAVEEQTKLLKELKKRGKNDKTS